VVRVVSRVGVGFGFVIGDGGVDDCKGRYDLVPVCGRSLWQRGLLGYVKGGGDYGGRLMLIYSNVAVRSARRG
jgi:hypothetical protein